MLFIDWTACLSFQLNFETPEITYCSLQQHLLLTTPFVDSLMAPRETN